MNRKKRVGIAAGLVVIGVLAIGWMGLSFVRSAKAQAEKQKITGLKVERGDLVVRVVETGTVDAVTSVEVKSRVDGQVAQLLVKEGDEVTSGQLVAVIDPRETQLRVAESRAQLRGAQSAVRRAGVELAQRRITAKTNFERARLRLAQLERESANQPTLTGSSIDSAEAAYRQAMQTREKLIRVSHPNEKVSVETTYADTKSALENAQREARRRKELLAKGYVSERESQDADVNLAAAQARFSSAEARLRQLKAQQEIEREEAEQGIKRAQADLARARAGRIDDFKMRQELARSRQDLKDAEAALRDPELLAASQAQSQASVDQIIASLSDAERRLGETEIRAPRKGVIARRLVQQGEMVTAVGGFNSGTPIVKLEDRSAMLIKLSINEIDVAKLKLGMRAEVAVDALPGKTYSGEVTKIAPTSNVAAANSGGSTPVVKYDVEITLKNPTPDLKSGLSARCTVKVTELKNVVKIPIEYMGRDGAERFVMVKSAGADPKRVTITTGIETGAFVEVKSGIKVGDSIVLPKFVGPKRAGAFDGPGGN
jgi:HlyD family secretion protein